MSTYRMTAARRAALKKAQLASARKRKRGMSKKKKLAIGAGVAAIVGVAAGGYALDRKYNTMTVYHATSHARARKIAAEGFKDGKHRARAYRNIVDGVLHEKGRVFLSITKRSADPYGVGVLSARVRKKKFYKYATQDVHPKTLLGEKYGFKSGNSNHYHVNVSDLGKAGIKLKYTRQAQKDARRRLYERLLYGPWNPEG